MKRKSDSSPESSARMHRDIRGFQMMPDADLDESERRPIRNIAGLAHGRRLEGGEPFSNLYTGEAGFDSQGCETRTSREQKAVESLIHRRIEQLEKYVRSNPWFVSEPRLLRDTHLAFLASSMRNLDHTWQTLNASGPWLCYWMVHAYGLLGGTLSESVKSGFVRYLKRCEHPRGGYGGSFMQDAHLAPTYGAINCLISLGTTEAFESIDRKQLLKFLRRMHQPDGSYVMHDGGEVDIRGVYCALSVAKLTNILVPELSENCVDFLIKCQTYEGGFGSLPGVEAHGGYSFCGIAALSILESEHRCDLPRLLKWLIMRQCTYEGGFNGRTNKLVDGCYSFWQGGALPIVYRAMQLNEKYVEALPVDNWLFDQRALQEYILSCCQTQSGGLIDKPEKLPDFYHTCYVLSGLSIAQHFTLSPDTPEFIIGDRVTNRMKITDAVHNVLRDCLTEADDYFSSLPELQ